MPVLSKVPLGTRLAFRRRVSGTMPSHSRAGWALVAQQEVRGHGVAVLVLRGRSLLLEGPGERCCEELRERERERWDGVGWQGKKERGKREREGESAEWREEEGGEGGRNESKRDRRGGEIRTMVTKEERHERRERGGEKDGGRGGGSEKKKHRERQKHYIKVM